MPFEAIDDKPLEGAAIGSAFIQRIAAGHSKDGDLLAIVTQCDDAAIPSLFQTLQSHLISYIDPKHVTRRAEAVAVAICKVLPDAMKVRGKPEQAVNIVQKPPPPIKRVVFETDASGSITGAVMRTGL